MYKNIEKEKVINLKDLVDYNEGLIRVRKFHRIRQAATRW